jgi:hypothetical protein
LNGQFDALVCMYHDQGLGPFKLMHFADGVNLTSGCRSSAPRPITVPRMTSPAAARPIRAAWLLLCGSPPAWRTAGASAATPRLTAAAHGSMRSTRQR